MSPGWYLTRFQQPGATVADHVTAWPQAGTLAFTYLQ